MIAYVSILALTLAISATAAAQDFAGVDRFWGIAAQLQADSEPATMIWDSLFLTQGYAALEARERRRSALELGFRAALMPSMEIVRDSILASA